MELIWNIMVVAGYLIIGIAPISCLFLARNNFLAWLEDKSQVFLLLYGITGLIMTMLFSILAYYVFIVWW